MILPSKTRIMIVPDFGVPADDMAMVALKNAIEAQSDYAVKVVDLPAVVRAEHAGEELTDSKIIELSARKLEQLAQCSRLIWDGSNDLTVTETKTIHLSLKNRSVVAKEPEDIVVDESIDIDNILGMDGGYWDEGKPDAIIVLGKSAMIAGGIDDTRLLFVNPEYSSEWPWKKQYYAELKAAEKYWCEKAEYEDGWMPTVLWFGNERSDRYRYVRRYGLITDPNYFGGFWKRYPGMAEIARELDGNTEALAKLIREFADGKLAVPYEEVLEALDNLPDNKSCGFTGPVTLENYTVTGICCGVPMAKGQSGYKLKVAELTDTLPLESIHTRRELDMLRDAITQACKTREPKKRILIVPDYFTPFDNSLVKAFQADLTRQGYYAAVFVHGDSLEKSRQGLERRCKVHPFDIIVAFESGCLLATTVDNCPRIFVNPDWKAWEWMRDDEKAAARQMAERAYIKRSKQPVYGWFSEDAIDSHLPEEHLKRFNTSTYIPGLRLDTDGGIAIVARQIANVL